MSSERKTRCLLKLRGILLLAVLLLAVASPEDEDAQAQEVLCKGLKPFNNLEELLCQFYLNRDSDCLFTMPVAELEKIWETKILSAEVPKPQTAHQPNQLGRTATGGV